MPEPMHISEALRRGLTTIITQDHEGKRLPTAYIMAQLSPNFFQDMLKDFSNASNSPAEDVLETSRHFREFDGDWDLPPTRCIEVQLENSPTFYNSIFSTIDESYGEQMFENGELPRADMVCDLWDYKASQKVFGLGAVEQANGLLQDMLKAMNAPTDAVAYLVYGSMYSPKEYNFKTDHTNAYLYYTLPFAEHFKQWMTKPENLTFIKAYLKNQFTARDGFMPFVSNEPDDDWTECLFAPADKMNSAQVGQWLGLGWFLATDKPKTVAEYCVWLADLSQVLFEECQESAENEGAPSQADIDKAVAEWLTTASDVDKAKWQLAQAERFTR